MIPGKTKLVMVESPTNPRMQVRHTLVGLPRAGGAVTNCSVTKGTRQLTILRAISCRRACVLILVVLFVVNTISQHGTALGQ